MLSTSETPFAILLAWLILSELPVIATAIGGTLVMMGVVFGGVTNKARDLS